MNVRVRIPDSVAAVVERPDRHTVRVHKYRVVVDGRRKGVAFGDHATDADRLDGLRLDHLRTTRTHFGHHAGTRYEPDPEVQRELAERGAAVGVTSPVESTGEVNV